MDDSLCNVRTVRIRWNIEAQVIIFFVQGPNQHGDDSERGRDESCDGLNDEGQRHARVFKIVNLQTFFLRFTSHFFNDEVKRHARVVLIVKLDKF